jgi:outer membrane lipopolysaccharide assembly protein LptE/RlpB
MNDSSYRFLRWTPALGLLVLLGCGYALVGRGTNIPDDVRSVYLETFENETRRAEVEQFVTQAIADELLTRRRFTLLASRLDSDAILSGTVRTFRVQPVAFDRDGRATEYEVTIEASVRFYRRDSPDEENLWASERYIFRQNYEVELESSSFIDQENIAIEQTALVFASTMVADLLEGF